VRVGDVRSDALRIVMVPLEAELLTRFGSASLAVTVAEFWAAPRGGRYENRMSTIAPLGMAPSEQTTAWARNKRLAGTGKANVTVEAASP